MLDLCHKKWYGTGRYIIIIIIINENEMTKSHPKKNVVIIFLLFQLPIPEFL